VERAIIMAMALCVCACGGCGPRGPVVAGDASGTVSLDGDGGHACTPVDRDDDGYPELSAVCEPVDCDDSNPHVGALCARCLGQDRDQDGYLDYDEGCWPVDCDDTDPSIYPGHGC
jgi:hypothetical protein